MNTPDPTLPISLNGQARQSPPSLLDLLAQLGLDPNTGGVAVAINAAVVPRSRWPHTTLQPHDDVEIVRATAGG